MDKKRETTTRDRVWGMDNGIETATMIRFLEWKRKWTPLTTINSMDNLGKTVWTMT